MNCRKSIYFTYKLLEKNIFEIVFNENALNIYNSSNTLFSLIDLIECVKKNNKKINSFIFNFKNVTIIDSIGIGVLIESTNYIYKIFKNIKNKIKIKYINKNFISFKNQLNFKLDSIKIV